MRFVQAIGAVAVAIAVAAAAALAADPTIPPGGAAPKALTGTWAMTLTAAELRKAPLPSHMSSTRRWLLVIVNSGSGKYPRVLGLRPAGEGSASIPFGVQKNLLHIECLNHDNELPTTGHDTLAWSIAGGMLRFRVVGQHCKSGDDRNDVHVLTRHPWKRAAG